MMNPNKRGPVELQLIETARLWTARGGYFASFFPDQAPDWYVEAMTEAGGVLGVLEGAVDHRTWDQAVLRTAARERPGIAHLHFGQHTTARRLRSAGATVIRTEHSERQARKLEPLRRVVRHWRQRPLAGFLAVSDYLNAQTQRDFIVPAGRVRTIHNGADLDHFKPMPADRERLRRELFGITDDRVVITIAAHLIPRKRHAMLVRSMPLLLAAAPAAHLILAGGGPDERMLTELIAELGLQSRVSLLTGANDVAQIYAASDIGVLPSEREGLGGSAVEAMACGLPLVATPVGGLQEVPEDGVSGVLVHDQTAEGLAAAFVPLVSDPDLRARMGAAALRRARTHFDVRVAAAKTIDFYDSVRPPANSG